MEKYWALHKSTFWTQSQEIQHSIQWTTEFTLTVCLEKYKSSRTTYINHVRNTVAKFQIWSKKQFVHTELESIKLYSQRQKNCSHNKQLGLILTPMESLKKILMLLKISIFWHNFSPALKPNSVTSAFVNKNKCTATAFVASYFSKLKLRFV